MNEATPKTIQGVKFRFTGWEIQSVLRYSVEELRKGEIETMKPVPADNHKAEEHAEENAAKLAVMEMMIQRIESSTVYYLSTEEAKEFNLFAILAFLNRNEQLVR